MISLKICSSKTKIKTKIQVLIRLIPHPMISKLGKALVVKEAELPDGKARIDMHFLQLKTTKLQMKFLS
jgi:hypothetical protein